MKINSEFRIDKKWVGQKHPTYFIADIAANHDGDLSRAIELIYLCAEAGADAAKFQHFSAATIVSDEGFKSLGSQQSHQASWKKSVFEVYKEASVDLSWTATLQETCKKAGITFITSPYSFDLVDHIDPFVPAYKIGSGDITWIEIIEYIARKEKPVIIAAGASSMDEVQAAMSVAASINPNLVLMQCNTNYSASLDNFKHIQLNVLHSFREIYPDLTLGLSDHTSGHATVLGAVALGARVIEKHFTDDTSRVGPDHRFSMNPKSWRNMVDRTLELEAALGCGIKKVEDNEKETAVLQRRAIRVNKDLSVGTIIGREDLSLLRPCPADALPPYEMEKIIGKKIKKTVKNGEHLRWLNLN
jgi:N-acetylneuraminate synthase